MKKELLKLITYLYASKGKQMTEDIALIWIDALSSIDISLIKRAIKNLVYKKLPFPEVADVIIEAKEIISIEYMQNARKWIVDKNYPAELSGIAKKDGIICDIDGIKYYHRKLIDDRIFNNDKTKMIEG